MPSFYAVRGITGHNPQILQAPYPKILMFLGKQKEKRGWTVHAHLGNICKGIPAMKSNIPVPQ